MIRARFETTFTPNNPLEQFAGDFPEIVYRIGREAFGQIREPLLAELQVYPPELPNQKYQRTYRLRRGWKAGIDRINSTTFAITVSNDTEYTSFVVGSLAVDRSEAARFQDQIHQGRWKLATDTVTMQFNDFIKRFDQLLQNELSDLGQVVVREVPKVRR